MSPSLPVPCDLTALDADALFRLTYPGEVSCREVLVAYFVRIRRVNQHINAISPVLRRYGAALGRRLRGDAELLRHAAANESLVPELLGCRPPPPA